jgi:hypothetical protein
MRNRMSFVVLELAAPVEAFATALGIGLLIGMERERRPDASAGLRTFALVAMLGCLFALLGEKTIRFEARQLIWAAPAFVLPRVWPAIPAELRSACLAGDYAPWLTANLHLSDLPEERYGAPAAWDNVFYDSPGLGYVTATHQLIRRRLSGTVLTYYRALHDVSPAEGRRLLLETPREAWVEGILAELERVHPDIRRLETRVDLFRNAVF